MLSLILSLFILTNPVLNLSENIAIEDYSLIKELNSEFNLVLPDEEHLIKFIKALKSADIFDRLLKFKLPGFKDFIVDFLTQFLGVDHVTSLLGYAGKSIDLYLNSMEKSVKIFWLKKAIREVFTRPDLSPALLNEWLNRDDVIATIGRGIAYGKKREEAIKQIKEDAYMMLLAYLRDVLKFRYKLRQLKKLKERFNYFIRKRREFHTMIANRIKILLTKAGYPATNIMVKKYFNNDKFKTIVVEKAVRNEVKLNSIKIKSVAELDSKTSDNTLFKLYKRFFPRVLNIITTSIEEFKSKNIDALEFIERLNLARDIFLKIDSIPKNYGTARMDLVATYRQKYLRTLTFAINESITFQNKLFTTINESMNKAENFIDSFDKTKNSFGKFLYLIENIKKMETLTKTIERILESFKNKDMFEVQAYLKQLPMYNEENEILKSRYSEFSIDNMSIDMRIEHIRLMRNRLKNEIEGLKDGINKVDNRLKNIYLGLKSGINDFHDYKNEFQFLYPLIDKTEIYKSLSLHQKDTFLSYNLPLSIGKLVLKQNKYDARLKLNFFLILKRFYRKEAELVNLINKLEFFSKVSYDDLIAKFDKLIKKLFSIKSTVRESEYRGLKVVELIQKLHENLGIQNLLKIGEKIPPSMSYPEKAKWRKPLPENPSPFTEIKYREAKFGEISAAIFDNVVNKIGILKEKFDSYKSLFKQCLLEKGFVHRESLKNMEKVLESAQKINEEVLAILLKSVPDRGSFQSAARLATTIREILKSISENKANYKIVQQFRDSDGIKRFLSHVWPGSYEKFYKDVKKLYEKIKDAKKILNDLKKELVFFKFVASIWNKVKYLKVSFESTKSVKKRRTFYTKLKGLYKEMVGYKAVSDSDLFVRVLKDIGTVCERFKSSLCAYSKNIKIYSIKISQYNILKLRKNVKFDYAKDVTYKGMKACLNLIVSSFDIGEAKMEYSKDNGKTWKRIWPGTLEYLAIPEPNAPFHLKFRVTNPDGKVVYSKSLDNIVITNLGIKVK